LPKYEKPLSYLAKLGRGHFFPNDKLYDDAVDFTKCGHPDKLIDDELLGVRTVFIFLLGINIMTTYILNHEGMAHLFYYFSYWGGITSFLGLIFAQKSIIDKGVYQFWGVLLNEMSVCYNIMIVPLFWSVIAPTLFTRDWHGINLINNIHLCTTHIIPFVATFTNLYYTKNMVLLPQDWKVMFLTGIVYIYANYLGTMALQQPLYPIADWTNPKFTIFCYFSLAVVESTVYYYFSKWLCKKRNFNWN